MKHVPPTTACDGFLGQQGATYVLAEMACAHDGDEGTARDLVDLASRAGADAVQLQIIPFEDVISPLLPNYEQIKHLQLPMDSWRRILSHCREKKLPVWANVFNTASAELAIEEGAAVLKLHSSDLLNPDLMDAVSRSGKPISLGVGGSTLDEISWAVLRLRERGVQDLILMHGYQAYPTSADDAHISYIQTLMQLFGCPVGYQDHTDGDNIMAHILPVVAIGVGARVLEKHITIDRASKGTDYQSAFEESAFKKFVAFVRETERALGVGVVREMSDSEQKYRTTFKKSIVAAHDLSAGHRVVAEDLKFMRGLPGISPSQIDQLVGLKVNRSVPRFMSLNWGDFSKASEAEGLE
jgi:N,N'-diacetyllegionaminate synthase